MLELNLMIRLVALLFLSSTCYTSLVQSVCNRSSDLVGLYYAEQGSDLASVSLYLNNSTSTSTNTNTNTNTSNILTYNPNVIPGQIMYKNMHKRDASLTYAVWIKSFNSSHNNRLRDFKMIVVCSSCVDSSILKDFHLFFSYSLWQKKTLDSVSLAPVLSPEVSPFIELNQHLALSYSLHMYLWLGPRIQSFNFNFTALHSDITVENSTGIGFSRGRADCVVGDQRLDVNRNHPPLKTCSEPGLSHRAVVGITLGVLAVVMSHARCIYNVVYKKRKAEISAALLRNGQAQLMPVQGSESSGVLVAGLAGITVDKAVEFSYEELSKATNYFSLGNKIGQGGFGAVYYAELRGEKVAIKKMDMQASKQFLAELKVLTHVHHLNLVRLIGYCVEGSHILVYEYIENGNLSQHLQGSGKDPLPWSTRVQIALDSARGLEYIHEYTASVFIHCDIKSANILIDRNFRGKIADFGLTRLTEVGSRSRLVGTFGYMSPEYARYGDVTPKVDVYAFGVVLYELISAKKAIIRANDSVGEPKGLVALFDEVLSQADPKDGLVKMIDPVLADNYPLDSVYKMAQLAKACTHEDPKQRPHMRSIVAALTNLSSSV